MNEIPAVRKAQPLDQSSGSSHTLMTSRPTYMSEPIASKRVCFYKSGDAQFSGLPVVINNRTFKTFEALLDNLSKRVPLPFGVRTITTPHGHTTVRSLDQLHHGHSYICSDKRTVKPIDLERARRKPPPWYHARPVSSRRLAQHRRSPAAHSTRRARRSEYATLLHTPKRLVVFRNGNPDVKHTLLLQKRTTPSFEALLDLVSEVMHFPVLKLHTPDGRRVDGLAALIFCSGVLVASGREPFRKGNYDVQKPSAPTWLPAKRIGRLHAMSRKKKSISSSKSRPFSPSSERYIVNQIQNSFAGSVCDYPTNPTGSVDMETGQVLESVAETDTIPDGEGEVETHLPTDDDIEKSFRVNQDGSMTVEMKVRLTIKEEETIHWTTTLSRSSVANQMKSIYPTHPDLGVPLPENIPPDVDPVVSEEHDEALPKESGIVYKETESTKEIMPALLPLQPLPSTPECHKTQQKQTSVRAEIQENVLESCIYREETSTGEMKQEYHMVRECSSRPVPKPRNTLPCPELAATTSQLQSSTYKSAQILQVQERGEEVHETMLHIYKQQTCQENFYANTQLCVQGKGANGSINGRPVSSDTVFPASSEKTVPSSSEDLEFEPRPSTNYDTVKRQQSVFRAIDLHTLSTKSLPREVRSKKSRIRTSVTVLPEPSAPRIPSNNDTSKRRKLVRVIVKKNHIFQTATPEQRQRDNKTDILKEMKKIRADIFNRTRVMKLNEHYRAKVAQRLLKRRNNSANGQGSVPSVSHNTVELQLQSPAEVSHEKEELIKKEDFDQADLYHGNPNKNSASTKKDLLHALTTNKCELRRQTSMHEEQHFQRETRELCESISLPALHSSSSVFNEYVESWLQKSQPEPPPDQEEVLLTTTVLTPEVSEQTCETVSAIHASKEDLTCVSYNNPSSARNLSPAKSSLEETSFSMKETLPSPLTSEKFTRDSSQEDSSLPSNIAQNIPLLKTSSLKNNPWIKGTFSTDNLAEMKISQNESMGKTPLSRNITVKKIQLPNSVNTDNNTEPWESPLGFPKLPSNQQTISPPRSRKIANTGPSVEFLDKVSTDHDHVKKTSSSENGLHSQHSVEKIPKNNTLSKISLFAKQNLEEMPLHRKGTYNKNTAHTHSTLIKESESNIMLGTSKENKDSKTDQNHQSDTPLGNSTTSDIDSQAKSDANITGNAEKVYIVKMAVRPDMRPVLEELCHSIRSLREVTQHKRRSCLEKSNSLPDFSSHLATTFGSSSRVLLAFLSVMTLKDGLTNLDAHRKAEDNLSCSEALIMLQSLKDMAAIEDAEQLRASLEALQKSTSDCLLKSWRGFQELSDRSRSCSVTPDSNGSGSYSESGSEEEEAIQGLMEDLGVPEKVREELAALCTQEQENISGNQVNGLQQSSESYPDVKVNGYKELHQSEETTSLPDSVLEDVNMFVKSVIEKAINAHLEESGSSGISMAHSLVSAEKEVEVGQEWDFCHIQRTDQADSALESDICEDVSSHQSFIDEKQERVEESTVELIKTLDKVDVEVKHNGEHQTEAKSQRNQQSESIIEEKAEYPTAIDSKKENEKNEVDVGGMKESSMDIKYSSSSKSPSSSEDKLTTSEKSSLGEEEDSCDEELMSFSEDQATDKEENVDQTNSMQKTEAKWPSETLATQILSQHNKTDVESHVKESKTQHEVEQQQDAYDDKTIYSEEEQVVLESPECYTIYQEHFVEQEEYGNEEATECEDKTINFTEQSKHLVAEFISNLESAAQKVCQTAERPVNRFLAHIEEADLDDVSHISNHPELIEECERGQSDVPVQPQKNKIHIRPVSPKEPAKMPSTIEQSHMDLTSETLSSLLAFSYDSRNCSLAREPDGGIQVNRVKSIREMFLAKSSTRTHNGQRRLPSPNSDLSDYQTESTDSGGNRLQTSPEASSGEDDSSRLAIAKGFVRRTIEKLYGRTNSNSTGPDDERPPSASKGKRREGASRTNVTSLASFHEARTRVITDLTYFNATSSLDAFNEPTPCVTLNEQLRPRDAVLIDKGRWLLRENQTNPDSSSELQETPRKGMKDTTIPVKEDVPYSLFCPTSPHKALSGSECEETAGSTGLNVAYFNLPNARDAELDVEERKNNTPPKGKEVKVTAVTQSPKSWMERNSILPAFSPPVIKKTDNKVHPLTEGITPPVVTQPAKGHTAQTGITRRSAEPDALEMLFIFCGQHCPLL